MTDKQTNDMTDLHPAYNWYELARLALASRFMDELEEDELVQRGLITYQFSAKGHELGQLLVSQLLTYPFDAATIYYRSRPFVLGSGMTLTESFAAGMSRDNSMSDGRDVGVTFNLPRRERAVVLPMGGDVGSQYTPAVGWAQALRYRVDVLGETELDGSIAVAFGGDGSVATNGFWSALTIMTTLQLPVLIVIEDNGYAISVKKHLQTPGGNIANNLASFDGLTIWQGDGTDPAEASDLVAHAVDHVRSGAGPGLLRLSVPRLSGHTGIDNQAYKTEEELAEERSRDPIPRIRQHLIDADMMTADGWATLEEEVQRDVHQAAEEAERMPIADPEQIATHVFDEGEPPRHGGLAAEGITLPTGTAQPNPENPSRINMIEAVRLTLQSELALNPRLLVFGEDVGVKGGVHAATLGLINEFGEERVFDTSLSEEGIIGRAMGMAYAGLAPCPEIQFRKYADTATEAINNTGTIRWRTANKFAAPMVIRVPGGFRKIGDPWHSVTSEVQYAHAVGWKLAFPSNAADAVGLLRSALRSNDPTIFFEHRAVLDAKWARRPYPGDDYVLPFGKADLITTGDELTVVSWGALVHRVEQAAKNLDASIELIDLRTIVPWDKEAVLESVRKTSRCLIVHEDIGMVGFGAEIAAVIVDEVFFDLDAPVRRVTSPKVPVPFNTTLMDNVVPTIARIQAEMEDILTI